MTDKERIEEMANAICFYCKELTEENECFNGKECYEWRLKEARAYYEQGIRKIPEGSVIVSKQVWEEHIENREKTNKIFEERVRKETAREILLWLKEHCDYTGFTIIEAYFKETFGVDIKGE